MKTFIKLSIIVVTFVFYSNSYAQNTPHIGHFYSWENELLSKDLSIVKQLDSKVKVYAVMHSIKPDFKRSETLKKIYLNFITELNDKESKLEDAKEKLGYFVIYHHNKRSKNLFAALALL